MGAKNQKSLKNKLAFVVLGRSGSGKGVQAKFMVKRLAREGVKHLETGEFLRKLLKRRNPTTLLGRKVITEGGLFPAWFAAYTWLRELIEHGHVDKHLVFDGAARRVWEAELLDQVMRWHGRPLPLCINVDVSIDEATKRLLKRKRSDDTLRAIRNRMAFFKENVIPVLHYYRRRGRLLHINGEQTVEAVWQEIDRRLAKRLGGFWPNR